jgi:hypothetical protein
MYVGLQLAAISFSPDNTGQESTTENPLLAAAVTHRFTRSPNCMGAIPPARH